MKPSEAKTFEDLCSLDSDNWSGKTHWMLLSEYGVDIVAQKDGESSTESIFIPSQTFKAMIKWYNKNQDKRRK